jgi:hypothetical protein
MSGPTRSLKHQIALFRAPSGADSGDISKAHTVSLSDRTSPEASLRPQLTGASNEVV